MLACTGHEPGTQDSESTEAAPTVVAVGCAQPGDNTLRWSCTVTVEPPQTATLVYVPLDGGPETSLTLPALGGSHEMPLRFLRTSTSYDVTVAASGVEARTTFTTGDAPVGARLTYVVEGVSSVPYLLHTTPCMGTDFVVVSDTEGHVVWYQSLGLGGGADVQMVQLTEDDTLLLVADSVRTGTNFLREIDWDGNTLLEVISDAQDTERFHHDAYKHAGLVYALFHHDLLLEDGLTYKEDGYYVYDETGSLVDEWHLFDHFLPPLGGEPGGYAPIDYSHTNSIHVTDDLQVMLSLRYLSAVASVQGDPTQKDHGAITWRLGGNPSDPAFGTDFTLTSSASDLPTFLLQHHALPDGPDRITMFDNRGFGPQPSRVLGITLDRTLGVADIDEVYTLDQHCNFQGSAFFTAQGNPVATCAKPGTVYEWDAGVPETQRFKLNASCADGVEASIGRFVPLDP
jgi:hypothetical protein